MLIYSSLNRISIVDNDPHTVCEIENYKSVIIS